MCNLRYLIALFSFLLVGHPAYAEISQAISALRSAVVQIHASIDVAGNQHNLHITNGVIVDSSGLIITQSIPSNASVEVTLSDFSTFPAKIIATDPEFNLSYLSIETQQLLPYRRIATKTPVLGEQLIAAGYVEVNPPGEKGYFAASVGIVSSDLAPLEINTMPGYFLATDIHPAVSQNLLFNQDGQLISVAAAIDTQPARSTGAKYYPITDIPARIYEELKRGITPIHRTSIGLRLKGPHDLTVEAIFSNDLTFAGLKIGDQIRQFESIGLRGLPDLKKQIRGTNPDSSFTLIVARNDSLISILIDSKSE